MVAGLGMIDAVLCILAVKLKKPALIGLFLLSFICSLGMGYLSSRDFTKASMNWIAEGVNTGGQSCLLLGTILLRKNGLEELRLRNGETASRNESRQSRSIREEAPAFSLENRRNLCYNKIRVPKRRG